MPLETLKTSKVSTWGGPREGSGRKPKLQYEVRELFNKRVDDEWENLMTSLFDQISKGDKELMKWMIEQRIGKAPQSMDLNAKGVVLNVNEEISDENRIRVMEIAKRVSEELKKLKTD
jgi:hypothetical protein